MSLAKPKQVVGRRRRRGTLTSDMDALRKRYEVATRGQRRKPVAVKDPLYAATGDPLVLKDRSTAEKVYKVAGAKRPHVAIRKLAETVYGGALYGVVGIADFFITHRRWSALKAAAEAVALAAERGTWIGVHAPVSFEKAIDVVRREVASRRRTAERPYDNLGWTGQNIFVVPAPEARLRMPSNPEEILPDQGALVPDNAFWRRRVKDGDVFLKASEKKDQL